MASSPATASSRWTPTTPTRRLLDAESLAPSPTQTPLKPAKFGVNAGVGVCIALGVLVILAAMAYLHLRRRRHFRRIQAQERHEADLAAAEEGHAHSSTKPKTDDVPGSPAPPSPPAPAAAREWRVSDERVWRAELRKELEADIRELKRVEKAKGDASIVMVEDVKQPWKGKVKEKTSG